MKQHFQFLLPFLAVCCADSAKPPTTVTQNVNQEQRSTTEVSVSRSADAQPNPVCVGYCRQIAACWLTMSNADPMVAPADAERRCLVEQSNCQRPTADLHCCGKLGDCREFSQCVETSHNVLSACNEPAARPQAERR